MKLCTWLGAARTGDQLSITLSAPGYRPERAKLIIRTGRVPLVKLLRS